MTPEFAAKLAKYEALVWQDRWLSAGSLLSAVAIFTGVFSPTIGMKPFSGMILIAFFCLYRAWVWRRTAERLEG